MRERRENFLTILADNFNIYTTGGTVTPFSVSGNTVTMSNVNVSGGIQVGTKIQSADGKFTIDFANKFIQISI